MIPPYLYRVVCTEFLLFLIFSACLILYYGVAVVDPNCLEREARKLKRKLGGIASLCFQELTRFPFAYRKTPAENPFLFFRSSGGIVLL